MYLYICGSVGGRWTLMCRGRPSRETTGAIGAAPSPTRKFCAETFIVNLPCILEGAYEHMCDFSVTGVTDPSQQSRETQKSR